MLAVVGTATGAIPVIFDTDVATDFDDNAAIAFAIQNPALDVKLILTATGDTTARAKVVAKFLLEVNRTDIPIGIGVPTTLPPGPLYGWAADFDLGTYPGKVYIDGVAAAAAVINSNMAAGEKTQIIAIAPCNNFPSLLSRFPDVVRGGVVQAMSGSIHYGYGNSTTPAAEYNVRVCPECTAVMYNASWPVFITPLDTCGTVALRGSVYDTFLAGTSINARTLAQYFFSGPSTCRSPSWRRRPSGTTLSLPTWRLVPPLFSLSKIFASASRQMVTRSLTMLRARLSALPWPGPTAEQPRGLLSLCWRPLSQQAQPHEATSSCV